MFPLSLPLLGRVGFGKSPFTLETEQASTSGTAIDFTGISANAQRITIMFDGVSTNGTSDIIVQIGDSGGFETSAYLGAVANVTATPSVSNHSAGFLIGDATGATSIYHGSMMLTHMGSNSWIEMSVIGRSDAAVIPIGGGAKTLSDILTQVRITTAGGTDIFDAGAINILVEC